jgi:hypothetical protein
MFDASIRFKRHQLEEAISRVLDPASAKPSSELKSRMKVLLQTDRDPGRPAADRNHRHAFFSEKPPGKGADIWFSQYEAFALLTGLRLLGYGATQAFVVALLRRARPALEMEHARILAQDPSVLFDSAIIRQRARPGDLYVDNTDPTFLTIVSDEKTKDLPLYTISRGQPEAMAFMRQQGGRSVSLFELVSAAHRLSFQLSTVAPRRRGSRGGSQHARPRPKRARR